MKYLYTKKFHYFVVYYMISAVAKRRSDIIKLIQASKLEAAKRKKKIDTVDPILKTCKDLFPFLSQKELTEYAQTALRKILSEDANQFHQTTLLTHT
jgi:hypothetical protein